MAVNYKLTYFPVRARSEIIRLVFAAAKEDYTYVIVEWDDWPKLKPSTPYRFLPMLEIDGEKHGQSMAIAVHLATEFNLMGKTKMDRFLIEQLLQYREDVLYEETDHHLEKDLEDKAHIYKELEEEIYPEFMATLEKMLKKNNEGKGFIIGSQLTLGDLVLYGGLTTALQNFPKLGDNCPVLMAHRERISAIDGIKQHLEQRQHSVI